MLVVDMRYARVKSDLKFWVSDLNDLNRVHYPISP